MKEVKGSFTIESLDNLEKDLEKAIKEIKKFKAIVKKEKKVEYSIKFKDFSKIKIDINEKLDENLMKQSRKTVKTLEKILNREVNLNETY